MVQVRGIQANGERLSDCNRTGLYLVRYLVLAPVSVIIPATNSSFLDFYYWSVVVAAKSTINGLQIEGLDWLAPPTFDFFVFKEAIDPERSLRDLSGNEG